MAEFTHLSRIIADAAGFRPLITAVAMPTETTAIAGALEAAESGLVVPLLVGPEDRITRAAEVAGLNISSCRIVNTADDGAAAAREAVRLCESGMAEALMKGALHTDEIMHAVFKSGLRTPRRVSHVFVVDVQGYPRPLLVTDAAVNIAPILEDMLSIIQNSVDLAHAIGINVPRVAILSAVETVNPQIPSTVLAAKLRDIARRGGVQGAIVDGPLALDLALSEDAVRIKGVKSDVAGRADVLVAPTLEAANFLYKSATLLATGEGAGIVLGARVPVILTSRSSSVQSRIASAALALLYTRRLAAARSAHEPAIHADQIARPRT